MYCQENYKPLSVSVKKSLDVTKYLARLTLDSRAFVEYDEVSHVHIETRELSYQ